MARLGGVVTTAATFRCGDCGALSLPWSRGHAPTCQAHTDRARRFSICRERLTDDEHQPHDVDLCALCRVVFDPLPWGRRD